MCVTTLYIGMTWGKLVALYCTHSTLWYYRILNDNILNLPKNLFFQLFVHVHSVRTVCQVLCVCVLYTDYTLYADVLRMSTVRITCNVL